MPQRWTQEPHDINTSEDINAESLGDLCADENAISTWYVGDKTEEDIVKAVTALSSGFRSLDGFKVVFIDDNDLRDAGLNITPTKGVTQIEEYADLHRDVDQLKVRDLVALAEIVLRSVWKEDTQDINAEQLALWILQQIDMGKLKLEDLDKNFRVAFSAKIKKLINKNVVVYKELNDELRSSLEMQWKQNKRKTTCKFEMECPQYGNTPKSD